MTEERDIHPTADPTDHVCDHCGLPVRPDGNGWWIGPDSTSDCDADDRGHEVDGEARS
jgi:hypothetical protein